MRRFTLAMLATLGLALAPAIARADASPSDSGETMSFLSYPRPLHGITHGLGWIAGLPPTLGISYLFTSPAINVETSVGALGDTLDQTYMALLGVYWPLVSARDMSFYIGAAGQLYYREQHDEYYYPMAAKRAQSEQTSTVVAAATIQRHQIVGPMIGIEWMPRGTTILGDDLGTSYGHVRFAAEFGYSYDIATKNPETVVRLGLHWMFK